MKKVQIDAPKTMIIGGSSYPLLAFSGSIAARSLSGSFSATIVGAGTPRIGDSASVPGVLSGGMITGTSYSGGAWSVSGEGAGSKLSRSTPGGAVQATTIGGIIKELAEFCGLGADVSLYRDPLPSHVDARSLTPEGTCADAILHLAGLCGSIAVVPLDRECVMVRPARPAKLTPPTVLSRSGESLDTDGYATGIALTLNRKGAPRAGDGEDEGDDGENPSLRRVTRSGISAINGGTIRWSITVIEPLGVVERTEAEVTLPEQGTKKTLTGTYDYRIDESVTVRGGREHHCWKYGLLSAREAEETNWNAVGDSGPGWTRDSREFLRTYDAVFSRVDQEEETERHETNPTGTPLPAVPFSRRAVRSYSWDRERRGIYETEERYEDTDTGRVDYVLGQDGNPVSYEGGGAITLPQFQRVALVKHVRTRIVDEAFDSAGDCVLSVDRSTDDRGIADLLSRGLVRSEPEMRAAREFLLALPRQGDFRVNTSPGGSALPQGVFFFSLPGRRVDKPSSLASSRMDAPSGMHCPYIMESFGCGVQGGQCNLFDPQKGTPGFTLCRAYRTMAEAEEDANVMDAPPVFAIVGGGAIWHDVSVYLDAEIKDDVAQGIAKTMAENVLHVKQCSRGVVTSAVIPLELRLIPDGGIISVSHDLKSLTTSVTWAPCDVVPPETALITRVSSLAAAVFGRESVGKGREAPGRVATIAGGEATVLVAAHPVQCRATRGLEIGQSVLVYLPPGSTTRGRIRK